MDSPILMPTVPSPETPLAMDTDIESPEASSARGIGERRHGAGEQPGGPFGFSTLDDQERTPTAEVWGLPPPVSNSQAMSHNYTRLDTLPKNTTMDMPGNNGGGYDSIPSRSADRNMSGQQQDDQQKEAENSHYQLHCPDRENVDGRERSGGEYNEFGGSSRRQVERSNGSEQPTESSRLALLASTGWTSVNSASYNQRAAAHNGPRTESYFANHTHNFVARAAGAKDAAPEDTSMAQASVGAEEELMRQLDRQEQQVLRELDVARVELDRIRALRKKLLDKLSQQQRLLTSPQLTPARRTLITEPEDVEMSEASHPNSSSRWFAQAEKPLHTGAVGGRTVVLLSQLLNTDDDSNSGFIGPSSPLTNIRPPINEKPAAREDLFFHPPKPASPPPPSWQYPAVPALAESPRGKVTAGSARESEVVPFRRPQSWYNNRVKPGTVHGKESNKAYKSVCAQCSSSFRLPCQLR